MRLDSNLTAALYKSFTYLLTYLHSHLMTSSKVSVNSFEDCWRGVIYEADALPDAKPTVSECRRQNSVNKIYLTIQLDVLSENLHYYLVRTLLQYWQQKLMKNPKIWSRYHDGMTY